MTRLFDPEGPFNTPTMTVSLDPVIDQAVRDAREVIERFRDGNRDPSRRRRGTCGRAQPAGSDR